MGHHSPSLPQHWLPSCKALAGIALIAWPAAACAQSAVTSAPMLVQAEVVEGCQIGTASSGQAGHVATLQFPSASGLESGTKHASTSAGQVATIRCTIGTDLTIRYDAGQYASGGMRRMRLGSSDHYLAYDLCSDAACSPPIAANAPTERTISESESQNIRLDIHGQVTLSGNHAAGQYTDTVTITFSW
jgi:spore coat protein U-like protein